MPKSPLPAINALWQWWLQAREWIYDSMARNELGQHADEISQYVKAIHEDMEWEFGPGLEAEHAFCLSGRGDPTIRVLAERACMEAPDSAADERFEFHPVRLPHKGDPSRFRLRFDDAEVPLEDFRVVIEEDESRELLHIGIWHPFYPNAPEGLPGVATFVALDNTVGEDGVETWLGAVDLLDEPPDDDAVNLLGLRDAVNDLASRATGERWAVMEGEHPESGLPMLLTANLALKRWSVPDHDQCCELRIRIRDPREEGLPDADEQDVLNDAEDRLLETLGDDAVYFGRETGNGTRSLHLAATGRGPAEQQIADWQAEMQADGYEVDVIWIDDPAWSVRRRWM